MLCSESDEGVVIKIADFGLSKAFANGSVLETSCGTPDYAAPVCTGLYPRYEANTLVGGTPYGWCL